MDRFHLPIYGTAARFILGTWGTFLLIFFATLILVEPGPFWKFFFHIYLGLLSFSILAFSFFCRLRFTQAVSLFQNCVLPQTLWRAWQSKLSTHLLLVSTVSAGSISLIQFIQNQQTDYLDVWSLFSAILAIGYLTYFQGATRPVRIAYAFMTVAMLILVMSIQLGVVNQPSQISSYPQALLILILLFILFAPRIDLRSPPEFKTDISLFNLSAEFWTRINPLLGFYHRYSSLHKLPRNSSLSSMTISILMLIFLALDLTLFGESGLTTVHHFFVLFGFTLSVCILGKDLHWRFLLLPKSLPKGRIGIHLFISTICAYFYFFCVVMSVGILFYVVFDQHAKFPNPAKLSSFWITGLEAIMCISIAISIKGAKKPHRVRFYIFFSLLLSAALYLSYLFFEQKNPIHSPIMPEIRTYIFFLICITAFNIVTANRLWTRERLLAYL